MIWTIAYWILLSFAITTAIYALFWDRPGFRGRPKLRCRKCWYDLTKTPGDFNAEPIQCSECGKKHKTKRSMHKTHRSKKWIAAALVIWLMAYSASVTPKIQKSGWGAAVPRIVIVGSLPFLSEEPGSGLGRNGAPARVQPSILKFESLVLEEAPPVTGGWGIPAKDSGYGWFSRRISFLLAHLESDDVLSDRTTVKGAAYKRLLSTFVQNGQAYEFESAWAQQVVFVRVNIDRAFGPMEPVYGNVSIRRLLDGAYMVRFGTDYAQYNCSTFTGMRMNGMFPIGRTAEEERQDWVGRHLWDSLSLVEMSDSYGGFDSPGYPMGTGKDNGDGTATLTLPIRYMRYSGTPQADRGDRSNWENAFTHMEEVRYAISISRTIQVDSSIELQDLIERSMTARLTVDFDRFKNKWVPVIKLDNNGHWPIVTDTIIFGGQVSVVEVEQDRPEGRGMSYFKSSTDSWWLWGNEQYTDYAIQRSRDNPQRSERVKRTGVREVLHPANSSSGFIAGELKPNELVIRKTSREETKLVIRMEYTHNLQHIRLGGLWGDRIYESVLQFDLPDWTPLELRRYIVNGTVPDHAMP